MGAPIDEQSCTWRRATLVRRGSNDRPGRRLSTGLQEVVVGRWREHTQPSNNAGAQGTGLEI